MNKSELVRAIHSVVGEKGCTVGQCEAMVNAFKKTVMDTVANGEKVSIVGFGSFTVINRKGRMGRNPATKQPIKIPSKKVPKFSPGKEFREKVI